MQERCVPEAALVFYRLVSYATSLIQIVKLIISSAFYYLMNCCTMVILKAELFQDLHIKHAERKQLQCQSLHGNVCVCVGNKCRQPGCSNEAEKDVRPREPFPGFLTN